MNNNLKNGVILLLYLTAGFAVGAGLGVCFGFVISAVGFDFGIWKLFWTVFWGCTWLGGGAGFVAWMIFVVIQSLKRKR
jgi:hypothetical protein